MTVKQLIDVLNSLDKKDKHVNVRIEKDENGKRVTIHHPCEVKFDRNLDEVAIVINTHKFII